MYGFLRNNGIDGWDLLGMVSPDIWVKDPEDPPGFPADPPRQPPPYKPPVKGQFGSCCTSETIREGEEKLNDFFNNQFDDLKSPETPKRGYEGYSLLLWGGDQSCFGVNKDFLDELVFYGIPKCWACRLVHYRKYLFLPKNHWWVECTAFDAHGKEVETISFDWWRKGATAGESPSINRDMFPYFNDARFPRFGNHCSSTE